MFHVKPQGYVQAKDGSIIGWLCEWCGSRIEPGTGIRLEFKKTDVTMLACSQQCYARINNQLIANKPVSDHGFN